MKPAVAFPGSVGRELEPGEVQFSSPVNLDPHGRAFFHHGHVYRAVAPAMAPLYADLLRNGRAEPLFAAGLVGTRISAVRLAGHELVLEHDRIPFISYATEWSGSMLKDAALLTLDLSLALDRQDLELFDAHPWNVLFAGSRPHFVDFTSIGPVGRGRRWRAIDQFVGTFVNPLLLMAHGCAPHARSLLVDRATLRGRSLARADVYRTLLQARRFGGLARTLVRRPSGRERGDRRATYGRLRQLIEGIEIPIETTRWSEYCAEEVDVATIDGWMTKRRTTYDVLRRLRPETVLDIGSNTGWFSKLSALTGSRVIAFDVDEPSINKLYLNPEARKLSILPLAMDFRKPTPAYGVALRCAPAATRFRCELVLALAIVHHLVFGQNATFESIAGNLAEYTRRWLLVEYIPREDVHVAPMYSDRFAWYTLDGFVRQLEKHFTSVEVLPSNPQPRVLLLCRV